MWSVSIDILCAGSFNWIERSASELKVDHNDILIIIVAVAESAVHKKI